MTIRSMASAAAFPQSHAIELKKETLIGQNVGVLYSKGKETGFDFCGSYGTEMRYDRTHSSKVDITIPASTN